MTDDMLMSADGRSLRRGRRAAARHPIERATRIWRAGRQHAPVAALAKDISTTGVGLHTRQRFKVGDDVVVDIKRGRDISGDTFIYLRGRVVWTHAIGFDRRVLGIEIEASSREGLDETA